MCHSFYNKTVRVAKVDYTVRYYRVVVLPPALKINMTVNCDKSDYDWSILYAWADLYCFQSLVRGCAKIAHIRNNKSQNKIGSNI